MENLLTDDKRLMVASRLRSVADGILEGRVSLDSFTDEPEWIDQPPLKSGLKAIKPTGRITLTVQYWAIPITELK
jgi:hypothetical protein